jgi:type II secretory pathway pseudopilin PulG
MAAMESRSAKSAQGFTLLEVCIAILIAVLVIGAAIPSLQGVLQQNHEQGSFKNFDDLAQDAHNRSVSEQRTYCLVWQKKGEKEAVILRPEEPKDKGEADGVRRWTPEKKGGSLELYLPAILKPRPVDAIWTFWPNGTCEPAKITYKEDKNTGWQATYNPFTVEADVDYD